MGREARDGLILPVAPCRLLHSRLRPTLLYLKVLFFFLVVPLALSSGSPKFPIIEC
jgi:hypothetical protein